MLGLHVCAGDCGHDFKMGVALLELQDIVQGKVKTHQSKDMEKYDALIMALLHS